MGAFAAVNVTTGNNVLATFQSGFPVETPSISTFVAYAERSVVLGSADHTLGGDIGVAATAPAGFGPQLIVGNLDGLDCARNLFAPSVSVGTLATVGTVEANALTNSGSVGLQVPFPATAMPPVPTAGAGAAGTSNISVGAFQIQTLSPGAYGSLADNGTVNLAPGAYSFASVTLGDNAHLVAQPGGATTISIAGTLSTGQWAHVLPALQTADKIALSVAGNDGPGPSFTPAVSIGAGSQITSLLLAPHGTVRLGDNVQVTGAIAGYDIAAGNGVSLVFQAGFPQTSAVGTQQLHGYFTSPVAGAPILGPVPQGTAIPLGIALPLQNKQQLDTFIQQVSDPTSPTYRQYLTPSAFAASYGATASDYNNLVAWGQSYGLTTDTFSNRLMLDVRGTAGAVEQALHVNLTYRQRSDGTSFVAVDRDPSLSAPAPAVLRVTNIDVYSTPLPLIGSGPGGSYMSSDFRNAYASCAAQLNGSGQTVAVYENDACTPAEIAGYVAAAGLGTVPAVSQVPVNAFVAPTGSERTHLEACADIEMALAMAPQASVIAYEGFPGDAASILHRMATASPLSLQNSISIGFLDEAKGDPQFDTEIPISEMAAQGQTVFVASGDGGRYTADPNPSGPDVRDAPYATLVGGTVLTTNAPSTVPYYAQEQVWCSGAAACSGGGYLSTGLPAYQAGLTANQASAAHRNAPDVALVASGVGVFSAFPSAGYPTAQLIPGLQGTSLAAPLWAGFTALINQQNVANQTAAVGFLNPALYKIGSIYQQAFNDVTTGGNGFAAGPSYDLATGWGTPQCGLIAQLASNTPIPPIPFVDCVRAPAIGSSAATAVFGYNNPLSTATTIAASPGNQLSPAPAGGRTPGPVFLPGVNHGAFVSQFYGASLTWTLLGQTVTANLNGSPICTPSTYPYSGIVGLDLAKSLLETGHTRTVAGAVVTDSNGQPIVFTDLDNPSMTLPIGLQTVFSSTDQADTPQSVTGDFSNEIAQFSEGNFYTLAAGEGAADFTGQV